MRHSSLPDVGIHTHQVIDHLLPAQAEKHALLGSCGQPSAANRFLTMMSELTLGWLLLEQAVIALEKAPSASNADKAFYEGKRYAAQFFAMNTLPHVAALAGVLGLEDDSALAISDEAFAQV